MATTSVRAGGYESADRPGHGWIAFAGTMLAIVGVVNLIYGIAAISDSKFYVHDAKYVIASLHTWGWFYTLLGAAQFFAAFSIWNGTEWGRWVGIISAGLNAIVQLLAIPGSPFLSLALFTIDILVIYGLIAYGGRQAAAA